MLAQLADVERGGRIKARREALHLTQPAVVERMEELAWELPLDHALHPVKAANAEGKGEAAKMPITLRGYQGYEKGGGIVWAKAKLLAQALRMDPHELMHGTPDGEPGATPTPFVGQDAVARLDAIQEQVTKQLAEHATAVEALIEKQNDLLARQSRILKDIEARLSEDRSVRDEISETIRRRGREIVQGLPADVQDPPLVPQRSQPAETKRAAKQRTR